MPKKFDEDAKGRVVRLVEDRILAENMSMREASLMDKSLYIFLSSLGARGAFR